MAGDERAIGPAKMAAGVSVFQHVEVVGLLRQLRLVFVLRCRPASLGGWNPIAPAAATCCPSVVPNAVESTIRIGTSNGE